MTIARIHRGIAQLLGLLIFVQLFLAGAWHAGVMVSPESHIFLGLGMVLLSLVNLILAGVGKLGKRVIGYTVLFFVLMVLQPIVIEFRRNGLPFLSAFHTLNAGILGMTISVLIKATSESVVAGEAMVAVVGD